MKTKESVAEKGSAFTLLELLVVIVIIGIVAGMALPVMNQFKPNHAASATRTMLDELARARQLAISQRTTVYMVIVPTNFWNDPAFARLPASERDKATKLYDKQLIGYAFVSLRSLGDQPGMRTVRYLSEWRSLPEGAFIALQKFRSNLLGPELIINSNGVPTFYVDGFNTTPWVPFPSAEAAPYTYNSARQPYVTLPYIAFDYMGRLARFDNRNGPIQAANEIIPLARGNVSFARNQATKVPLQQAPTVSEQPPGNSTNAYNLVAIDWLTGRARGIQQEVR